MAQKPTLAEDKKEVIKLETQFFISLLALNNDERSYKEKIASLEKELEVYNRALAETQVMKDEILAKVSTASGVEKEMLTTVYTFTGKEFVRVAK
jgi:hypothetical protein